MSHRRVVQNEIWSLGLTVLHRLGTFIIVVFKVILGSLTNVNIYNFSYYNILKMLPYSYNYFST